jgi:hypothetical protein
MEWDVPHQHKVVIACNFSEHTIEHFGCVVAMALVDFVKNAGSANRGVNQRPASGSSPM